MKIFLIGENKTGSTSLTEAMKLLRYNICPETYWYDLDNKRVVKNFLNGDYDFFFKKIKNYDFFEDRPWNLKSFYKTLYSLYPESKFILTEREPKNWLDSYRRWSKKN